MTLTTTTGAAGRYKVLTGTKQEVLDALDSFAPGLIMGGVIVDGASYSVTVKARR